MQKTYKSSNIPKLRFPEFSYEWKNDKLYDLLDKIIDFRGRTPLKLGMDWGGNIQSLSALNVKMGYIDFSLDTHLGSEELYKKWMTKGDLYKNDIIMTMEAPLGNVALIPDNKKYILSQRVMALKTKLNIDNHFIYQLLSSNNFQQTIKDLSTGSTAKGINQRSLQKVKVIIPEYAEQQKIADFLTAVDGKIALMNKSVELLKQYKKGVMQKIFSQEIRFRGEVYTDWAKAKFDDVLLSLPTKAHQILSSEYSKFGKYPVIDQGQKYIIGYTDHQSKLFKETPVIVFGDHTTFLKYIDFEFVVGADGTKLLKQRNNDVLKYLFYYLEQNQLEPEGYKRHFSNLRMINISLPAIKEQQKIADFLTGLDDKINLKEKELEQARQFKKALLQRMFV